MNHEPKMDASSGPVSPTATCRGGGVVREAAQAFLSGSKDFALVQDKGVYFQREALDVQLGSAFKPKSHTHTSLGTTCPSFADLSIMLWGFLR